MDLAKVNARGLDEATRKRKKETEPTVTAIIIVYWRWICLDKCMYCHRELERCKSNTLSHHHRISMLHQLV